MADDDTERHAADMYEKWGDTGGRVQLQDELAARAGIDPGRVLVHLPEPDMMAKLARVRVLLEQDTVVTFEEWENRHAGRVQALNRAHERLWRVSVYLHPDDAADEKSLRLVGSAARELFGIRSRYAEHEVDQPYLATVYDLHAPGKWPGTDREDTLRKATDVAASASNPKSLTAAIALVDAVVGADAERDGGDDASTGQSELSGE